MDALIQRVDLNGYMPRYEHTPRPNVEYHYHIRDLIESQDKRATARNEFRAREKEKEERESLIQSTPAFVLTDFWCDECRKDFKAQAIKEVEVDWSNVNQRVAFYRTKHWCGAWCIRLVTDKNRDRYWFKSKAVRTDRGRHMLDLLQPFEEGYQLMYGKK